MKTRLTTIAETIADVVIYDRRPMQNILLDEASANEVICLIDEVNQVNLTTNSNGIDENFRVVVAFVKQVNFQETADLNDAEMTDLLTCCKKFVLGLVDSELFQRDIQTAAVKYEEREADFNAIGWRMTINLNPQDGYTEC